MIHTIPFKVVHPCPHPHSAALSFRHFYRLLTLSPSLFIFVFLFVCSSHSLSSSFLLHFNRFFLSFFPPSHFSLFLSSVSFSSFFFLIYSLTHAHARAHTNIRNRTYYPTTCSIPACNDSMALPHPFAIE